MSGGRSSGERGGAAVDERERATNRDYALMHMTQRRTLQRILSGLERRRTDILSVRSGDHLAAGFAHFGDGASIAAPHRNLGNTGSISVGARTRILQGVLFEALAPPGTVIIDIGEDCHLSNNLRIVAVNGVVLEREVAIADNVFLADTIHEYRTVGTDEAPWSAGLKLGQPLRIRTGAWIGANCAVTGGIEIGARAIVAPCSVVNRDVPPDTLVSGNPATPVRRRTASGSWEAVPAAEEQG